MPADFTDQDEVGAPEPTPRLCHDHEPVIQAAADHAHVGDGDAQQAREERARQCPGCYRLNDRRLR